MKKPIPLSFLLIAILVGIAILVDYLRGVPPDVQATYVGSGKCAECHQSEFDRWHASPHDRAMDLANSETVLGDFDSARLTYQGVTSRMFREGDRYMIHTEGPDGEMDDFEVKYVFGFDPLQQYMVEFPDGRVQVLRVSWDTQKEEWFYHYPPDVRDEKLAPDDPLHWTGRMSNWQQMCAECHSTNLQKHFDIQSACYQTTFAEIDVSCETCHGPGSLHVQLAEAPSLFWDRYHGYGLPDLKSKNSKIEIESCAPCHSRRHRVAGDFRPGGELLDYFEPALLREGLYHADGQIQDEVYVYGSFLQSKMHAKGIRCTDCHDPHTTRLKYQGNQLCTSCHQHPSGKYDVPAHHHHRPGSSGAQCVACHMPETNYMIVDPRRDHSIRNPRPDLSVELGVPNACTQCHLEIENPNEDAPYADLLAAANAGDMAAKKIIDRIDRQMLAATEKWYGEPEEKHPHFAYAFDAARKRKMGAEEQLVGLLNQKDLPGIVRATAIDHLSELNTPSSRAAVIGQIGHPDPLVRGVSIRSLHQRGYSGKDLVEAVGPYLTDPVRMVRSSAVGVLAPHRQLLAPEMRIAFDRAAVEFTEGQRADADLAGSHYNLANFSLDAEKIGQAEAEYLQALKLDPAFFPARFNLGMLYSRTGKDEEAEAAFRTLVAQDPSAGLPRYRLGLILGRMKKFTEAEQSLLQAIEREPKNFDYHYALAILYLESGALEKSLNQARRLEALVPGVPATGELIRAIQREMKTTVRKKESGNGRIPSGQTDGE